MKKSQELIKKLDKFVTEHSKASDGHSEGNHDGSDECRKHLMNEFMASVEGNKMTLDIIGALVLEGELPAVMNQLEVFKQAINRWGPLAVAYTVAMAVHVLGEQQESEEKQEEQAPKVTDTDFLKGLGLK